MDKKKRIILIILALLILCVGTTLAYIIAQLQDSATGNASVTSDTVDLLKFEISKDITLNPTQFNVVEGGSDLSDSAVGSAILRANSINDNATYNYYVYFQINSNNYIYTTDYEKPEIILTITGPTGSPITSVDGLTYVESLGGFDITTKSGLFKIAELYEIVSNSSTQDTIQDWTFTVTFINLDTNQAENGGKTLEAEIILSKEPRYTLANYIIENVYVEDGVNNLYYHDGNGNYENAELEAGDNSYRYSGGDYEIADEYSEKYATMSIMLENLTNLAYYLDGNSFLMNDENFELKLITAVSQKYCNLYNCNYEEIIDAVINDTNTELKETFELYLEELINSGELQTVWGFTYNNSIFVPYYDKYDVNSGDAVLNEDYDDDIAVQLRKDGYLKPAIDNYLCYGTDELICPNSSLYRIIGIFNGQVKIIKADYATVEELGMNGSFYNKDSKFSYGLYRWINEEDKDFYINGLWSKSELNLINLNTNFINYLNSIDSKWTQIIDENNWHTETIPENLISQSGYYLNDVKTTYKYEIGENSDNLLYKDKIGLMYISDYGYSLSPIHWSKNLGYDLSNNYFAIGDKTWLNLGLSEWTISVLETYPQNSYIISGVIGFINAVSNYTNQFYVRPVFYLKSNVVFSSGDGSIDNPYRIQI